LLYHRLDDGSLLLVAANGGADWNPHWLHNLIADPHAEVELDGQIIRVTASVLSEAERTQMWDTALRAFPGLEDAQRATTRAIPLVKIGTWP
jgi:deazaflavin-dependent oxidoreductase (nitroreductase family)